MMRKVSTYLKKGFLMVLVTAMLCSGSGISALASTTVVTDDTAVAAAVVSDNSTVDPQDAEEPQGAVVPDADEEENLFIGDPIEIVPEAEGEASDSTDVEYIYPEGSTSPSGIDLNGNSVIIKASEKDDSSTSPRYINLILDTDKDGVIDDGEEMVEIDGSTDLIGGPTIYGYYMDTEATEPISITSIGGFTPVIYGAYQSSLKTSGETAITMRMFGGEIAGYFYAANESQVIATGAPAVELYVNSESTTYTSKVMAGLNSEITVSETDKPGICVEVEKANIGNINVLQSTSYTYKESTGAGVKIDLNGEGVSALNGILGGQAISDGKETALFDINIKSTVNAFYGSQGATLNAGANTATVMDIDVTDSGYITGNGFGVYGSNNSSTICLVTGHVDVNYAPKAGTGNNINWFYAVSQYLKVDGNVNVKVENARGQGLYVLNYYCYVTGNVTLDIPKGSELTSNVYGMYNSKCDGNLTVRVYGCTENTSAYNNVYGYTGRYGNTVGTVVGGDFVFDYLGGRCYYLYAGNGNYSSTKEYDKIGGKVDITVRGGDLGSVYLLQYADVTGDITATVGDYTTDLTIEGNEPVACVVSSSFTAINYCNAKNVTYKVRITNGSDNNKPYHYCVQNTNISGNLNVNVDGGCYYYLYGGYNCIVGGKADIQFKNINEVLENYSQGGTTYGFNSGNVVGDINVNVEDSKFSSFYATNYHGCEGSITSTIKNVKVYSYLYGPYPSSCGGDVVSTITDSSANYVYGAYQNGKIGGNVTVNLKNITQDTRNSSYCYLYGFNGNSGYAVEKDVTVTMENCSFNNSYGISGGSIMGNLVVDIKGGVYGTATESSYNYFASPNYVKGTSIINVSDVTYYGSVYPYYCSSGGCGDATITVINTQFNTGYYPNSEQIAMTPGAEQKVTMTLDEDCSVADTLHIYAGGNAGEGTIQYDGKTYIGGSIRFAEDTTYDTIYLSGGNFHIPEDVTLKIDKLYWESGNILLDGTLDAVVMSEVNEDGVYPNTTVYMAGGTMNVDLSKVQTVYWPFTENYKAKGGTVAYYNNYSYKPVTHMQGGNRLFAKVGQEIKYNISAAEGWTLASVTYTAEDVTNNVAASGTTYTFTMPNAAVSFDVDFQGNQIVVGKTVADPVLKLNVATTEESPAYDLSSLSISNDGVTGSVTYKVDSTYTLPEGLSLEGDKVIGTPTVAYESGKKTIIHVTGKNDTSVELPINFVITTGNGTQTSQEGRITVDETNQMIYTNGNSVVIGIVDNQTAIYIDDNKDGVADFETPAVVGDYTNYTLYGLRNTDTKMPICITMNDGTIGKIIGAQNGDITADGNSLGIYIYGGNVGEVCALDAASVTGTFELIMKPEATITTYTITKNSASQKGYLL